jgi:hypothetical protein
MMFVMGGQLRLVGCVAIFRLEAKIISRSQGRSAVASAAYRTGSKLRDERADRIRDYSKNENCVIQSVILTPANAPEWARKTETLWQQVEASEKRRDAQLSREILCALPKELSVRENFQLAVEWAQKELVSRGMIVEVSMHNPNGGSNPHVHMQATLRRLDGDHFSAKKAREWNDRALVPYWRESWANAVNAALEKAGFEERVDHRSLKDRGIDREPEPKLGPEAVWLHKRGVVGDPRRFQLLRWVKSLNAVQPFLRAIERFGEIRQEGMGTWWERSLIYAKETSRTVRDSVMDAWHSFTKTRSHNIPQNRQGPDLDRER